MEKPFRSDLYYRLNLFPVVMPPLRERPEAIPMLVRYFAQKYSRRGGPLGAAARLGMNRTILQFRMKKLIIARPM